MILNGGYLNLAGIWSGRGATYTPYKGQGHPKEVILQGLYYERAIQYCKFIITAAPGSSSSPWSWSWSCRGLHTGWPNKMKLIILTLECTRHSVSFEEKLLKKSQRFRKSWNLTYKRKKWLISRSPFKKAYSSLCIYNYKFPESAPLICMRIENYANFHKFCIYHKLRVLVTLKLGVFSDSKTWSF